MLSRDQKWKSQSHLGLNWYRILTDGWNDRQTAGETELQQ